MESQDGRQSAPNVRQVLPDALESFLSAPESRRRETFKELVATLNEASRSGSFDEAAMALQAAALPSLDYTSAQSLVRIMRRLQEGASRPESPIRIALLGSFTMQQLNGLIELFLSSAGVGVELYEADYDVYRQEILDPESRLYEFTPEFVFIGVGRRDLAHVPPLDADRDEVARRVDAEIEDWRRLWESVNGASGCQVVQNNFAAPPWRLLGNYEMRHHSSLGAFVSKVNQALQVEAPPFVTIHDVDHLAALVGRRAWSDDRFFHHAKLPCAPECLVEYAHSVASVISAQIGLSKKCLVLDLDNTLWGGVVGDDGLAGIRLGQGDAESESFQEFQRYVRGLRRSGVILAVCSANEEHIARQVFEEHPEMVLRLDDISCFVANWTDKATNLRRIAEELNIGLNSLVFVDDDPGQRSLVRQLTPEVSVPEMPVDPSEFIPTLERHRYFQIVSLSAEDLHRTQLYRANAERRRSMTSSGTLEGFLDGLKMRALIEPIHEANIQRSVQLIARTNQFNLTTRRHPQAAVLSMVESDEWITRAVRLSDRFGDNGLISVLLARKTGSAIDIDTWLMSCRVLKRGVESFMMNHLHEFARAEGSEKIRAEYIPTAKNGLVADHYERLGFESVQSHEDGRTRWELSVEDDWKPLETFVQEIEPE